MTGQHDNLMLVPCPRCDGAGAQVFASWVYEHGCGFGHEDSYEEACPDCEGNGQQLVEGHLVNLEDLWAAS